MDEVSSVTEDAYGIALFVPDEDHLYRQIHFQDLDKESSRYPRASHFKLKTGELDLSVNWSAFITYEQMYHLIGLSYNPKQEFKDIKLFKLFKFEVKFFRNLSGVEKVIHTPVYNGNPAPVGKPNNYAHTSVFYEDDEEIRKKISNYCNSDYENRCFNANFELLETVVKKLQDRLNSTNYHCCRKKDNPVSAD